MNEPKLEDCLCEGDISGEKSRTYTIYRCGKGVVHHICIDHPVKLFYYKGGKHIFHRIFDGEIMHLTPKPGFIWGYCGEIVGYCEVTWIPKDPKNPCVF